jgi:hypothetical protein
LAARPTSAALAAANGSDLLGYTAPGTGAATRTVEEKLAEIQLSVMDYRLTGDADDTAAFQRTWAVANASAAASVRIVVPPGSYSLASASLAATRLVFTRSNVIVEGFGATLTITGTTVVHTFYMESQSNITFRGLSLVGNNQANVFAAGAAIAFVNNSASDIANLTVEQCRFQNYKADYWIYSEPYSTGKIRGIRIRDNDFISLTGNSRGPSNIAIQSGFVGIYGSSNPSCGVITDVWITDNRMFADYVKSGVIIMHNVRDFHVTGNTIKNAGQSEASDDSGSYAIIVYETYPPANGGDGVVADNIILNPRDCGIYQANSHDGMVYRGNIIRGQTSTATGTLPKGGIILNGGINQVITGNEITNCASDGIWWSPVAAGIGANAKVRIADNIIDQCLRGIFIQSAFADSYNVVVASNSITECLTGIYVDLYTTATLTGLVVQGNNIRSALSSSYGVRFNSPDATYKVAEASVIGNKIDTTHTGILASGLTTGSVELTGNQLHGPYTTAAFNLDSSTKLIVGTNSVTGQTVAAGGYCFRTTGARGPFAEQLFYACETNALINNSGSEDLGRSTPTWSPTGRGVKVWAPLQIEQGTTPQKSLITGWQHDGTAWRTLYMHTEVPS